jgi:hypothetical protein
LKELHKLKSKTLLVNNKDNYNSATSAAGEDPIFAQAKKDINSSDLFPRA